jgi:hypothetical protein
MKIYPAVRCLYFTGGWRNYNNDFIVNHPDNDKNPRSIILAPAKQVYGPQLQSTALALRQTPIYWVREKLPATASQRPMHPFSRQIKLPAIFMVIATFSQGIYRKSILPVHEENYTVLTFNSASIFTTAANQRPANQPAGFAVC